MNECTNNVNKHIPEILWVLAILPSVHIGSVSSALWGQRETHPCSLSLHTRSALVSRAGSSMSPFRGAPYSMITHHPLGQAVLTTNQLCIIQGVTASLGHSDTEAPARGGGFLMLTSLVTCTLPRASVPAQDALLTRPSAPAVVWAHRRLRLPRAGPAPAGHTALRDCAADVRNFCPQSYAHL